MKTGRYVTTRDILIPAGTEVTEGPVAISRGVAFASALIAVSKDSTAEWTMPLEEAIDAGLVRAT